MAVRDKDQGYKDLVRRVFGVKSPKVTVGIHEAAGASPHGDDEMTILDVAIIHEFGLGNVPERSFIRAWFDENQDRAREAIRRMLESVVAGKRTPEQALQLFGQWAVGDMQKRMAKGIPPPLAPATIAKKGSSTPLIDTGQLRSSLTYEVDGKERS